MKTTVQKLMLGASLSSQNMHVTEHNHCSALY